MGANEKRAATYHGGQYTPMTMVHLNDDLTRIKHTYADSMRTRTGIGAATFDAEFDRMIAHVRAEAKAEALNEAASEIYRLDGDDAEMYNEDLNATPVTVWLRARANQYKENQ